MRSAVAVGVAAVTCLMGSPAQAAPTGRANTFQHFEKTRVGGGWLVTGYCGTFGEVAVGSTDVWLSADVSCTVNGFTFRASSPGPYAIAPVTQATTGLISFCISGSARFVDAGTATIYSDSAGPTCGTV